MAQTTERKKEIIEQFKVHETDTGSCEVQIALLTDRIKYLTEHFQTHAKDHHGQKSLHLSLPRRDAHDRNSYLISNYVL